jgi:hypothetical protein
MVALQILATLVQAKVFPEFLSRKTLQNGRADYGVDDGDDDVLIVVFVSVFSVVAGDGFTTVVLVSFFS